MFRGSISCVEETNSEIIALKILDYLNQHPDAQDSTEGITAWWLRQVDINYQSSRINEVLKTLTAKDVLQEQRQMGSLTYKLNPDRRDEISSLLEIIKF
jgi:hypothetical protein